MTLLGFCLENSLKLDLENNFENDLLFANNVVDFMSSIKNRKYEAVIIEEHNIKYDVLINLISKISEYQKKAVIIVIGESSDLKVVAGSIKAGAYDYILKPIDNSVIIKTIEKSVKDYKLMAERVEKHRNTGSKLIGRSKEMVELYKRIGKVAISDLPVLIVGEPGTGKISVANAIHQFSYTSTKPLVTINCNSFRAGLIERKLFGYEKGAFEGAVFTQIGDIEKADDGILHLRNIESLSLDMQSKILYLLEEGAFFRLGGAEPIKLGIRVIASTSENLENMIAKGLFIDELYRRLKVLEITIPPLRERKDDIPFIVENCIAECNQELHTSIKGVSKPAIKKMLRYDWPGNINELKNAIKSAVTLCRGTTILIDDLPNNVLGENIIKKKPENHADLLSEWVRDEISDCKEQNRHDYYETAVSKVERELIRQVLEITNGKKVETADILGITRNTLRTKMNNYGLE